MLNGKFEMQSQSMEDAVSHMKPSHQSPSFLLSPQELQGLGGQRASGGGAVMGRQGFGAYIR